MATHEEKANKIAERLRNRKSKEPVMIIKKSVSHQVPKPNELGKEDEKIDISELNKILQIDIKNRTCTAEPGITFSDLVKETLKHNLVPIVVPELKTITIGGAVVGCSIEATSYKMGGFHDNCLEYEIITAKGDVLKCTPTNENKEIFQMVHGTFGTLGILAKLKFKLMDAKQYVKMTYETYNNIEDYKKAIWDHYVKKDVDLMDGIIHSPEKLVLCIGTFVEKVPYTNSYDWMKVFYKTTEKRKEDYMKTYDYFFRYDSDCHWVARNYGLENPILRFLFGKFILSSTKMLKTAKKLNFIMKKMKPDVVVDVFIPFSNFTKFFEFYKKEFNYFPLWMVPYRMAKPYEWISKEHMKGINDQLIIDIAIYGMKQKGDKNYYKIMEDELIKLQGLKTLISYNYYDKETFWKIWNKENYFKIKNITDPDNILRDLYQKTCERK
jgi:hypothetical protein